MEKRNDPEEQMREVANYVREILSETIAPLDFDQIVASLKRACPAIPEHGFAAQINEVLKRYGSEIEITRLPSGKVRFHWKHG